MMLLRIKTDKIIHHPFQLTMGERLTFTVHRRHLLISLPPERVWLYLKVSRNINKFDSSDFTVQTSELELEGIEDKFAKCALFIFYIVLC